MQPRTTARVSLTALLGTPVTDSQGQLRGRLKDIAVATGPDAGKVAGLVLKTRVGLFIVPSQDVMETPAGTLELRSAGAMVPLQDQGNYLYLQQDLVDRQIIDIHGRKVVRVNDVDLEWMGQGAAHLLRVAEVEIGLRGAFRRGFKGGLPAGALESVSRQISAPDAGCDSAQISRGRHSLAICRRDRGRSRPPREAAHCARAPGRYASLGTGGYSRRPGAGRARSCFHFARRRSGC